MTESSTKGASRKEKTLDVGDLKALTPSLFAWFRKRINDDKLVEVLNWWLEGATVAELAELRGVGATFGRKPGSGAHQIAIREALQALGGWRSVREIAAGLTSKGLSDTVLQLRTSIKNPGPGIERRKIGGLLKFRIAPPAGGAS